jgi:hypothetical protein
MSDRRVRPFVARILVVAALCVSLSACNDGWYGRKGGPVPLQDVLDHPEAFAGDRVEIATGYYGSFEVSVLTGGFAESHPPQPVDPLVWVNASPPASCRESVEGVVWAERVVATGVLETGGGFGHLGQYEFELRDATIRCA